MISPPVFGKNLFLLKPISVVLGVAVIVAPVRAIGESEQRRGIENVLYLAVGSHQTSELRDDANGDSISRRITLMAVAMC